MSEVRVLVLRVQGMVLSAAMRVAVVTQLNRAAVVACRAAPGVVGALIAAGHG
jgi:hypothetical protein